MPPGAHHGPGYAVGHVRVNPSGTTRSRPKRTMVDNSGTINHLRVASAPSIMGRIMSPLPSRTTPCTETRIPMCTLTLQSRSGRCCNRHFLYRLFSPLKSQEGYYLKYSKCAFFSGVLYSWNAQERQVICATKYEKNSHNFFACRETDSISRTFVFRPHAYGEKWCVELEHRCATSRPQLPRGWCAVRNIDKYLRQRNISPPNSYPGMFWYQVYASTGIRRRLMLCLVHAISIDVVR